MLKCKDFKKIITSLSFELKNARNEYEIVIGNKKKGWLVVQNVFQKIDNDFNFNSLISGFNCLIVFVDDKKGEKYVKHILMCLVIGMHIFRGSILKIWKWVCICLGGVFMFIEIKICSFDWVFCHHQKGKNC